MDVKKIVLLVGALVIAAVTAFMARTCSRRRRAAGAGRAGRPGAGPKCWSRPARCRSARSSTPRRFRYQPWPKELVQNAYYIEGEPDGDPQSLIGTVVRNAITAGQPLTQGALVKPGDRGFLAAALGPGHARRHRRACPRPAASPASSSRATASTWC